MKKFLTLVAIAGSLTVSHAQSYTVSLSSLNEVPPNNLSTTDGSYAFANISLSGTTLSVTSAFYANRKKLGNFFPSQYSLCLHLQWKEGNALVRWQKGFTIPLALSPNNPATNPSRAHNRLLGEINHGVI
jgi:hypothetical protein